LIARDFIEVETPMMNPIAGGATAKPVRLHVFVVVVVVVMMMMMMTMMMIMLLLLLIAIRF
jgi:lysyl-tRNA synthetase class II